MSGRSPRRVRQRVSVSSGFGLSFDQGKVFSVNGSDGGSCRIREAYLDSLGATRVSDGTSDVEQQSPWRVNSRPWPPTLG